jgi:hypothetical protein
VRLAAAAALLVLASCGGAIAADDPAAKADAGALDGTSDVSRPHDAAIEADDSADPTFDAGTVKGGDVQCGSSVCRTPDAFCCHLYFYDHTDSTCLSAADPHRLPCGASLFCDDVADCASGVCCLQKTLSTWTSVCLDADQCTCNGVPNCATAEMCDLNATTDECPTHLGGACKPGPLGAVCRP